MREATHMSAIWDFFSNLWNQVVLLVSTGHWFLDIIDIAIVTFIIYKAFQFMRETRAVQLIKGILIIAVAYFAAEWLNLGAIYFIIRMVFQYGIIVLFVLFQPELRSALERMGRGNLRNLGKNLSDTEQQEEMLSMIDAVCKAAQVMQKGKVGALMVLERKTMLGEIAQTGTVLDAAASRDLICNVFYPKSPLHDGAMIIRGTRLYAAGCILPLTQSKSVDSDLGTRHRAAIGVSEVSDALVVVVSEETGIISIARNGTIERNYNPIALKEELEKALLGSETESELHGFKKLFKRSGSKKSEN